MRPCIMPALPAYRALFVLQRWYRLPLRAVDRSLRWTPHGTRRVGTPAWSAWSADRLFVRVFPPQFRQLFLRGLFGLLELLSSAPDGIQQFIYRPLPHGFVLPFLFE